jgi:hypothetical protein
MAGGPLQAADDMVRIIANGMTFGGADKIASMMGEQDTAAKTAAARERAGFAGDLASILGVGGGLKAGAKGVMALPAIAKAVVSKKGLAAAGLGLGGLVEFNSRTSKANATAPKPKAAAVPKPKVEEVVAKVANAASSKQAAQPASFDEMIAHLAAGQGGAISLRQLGALSEAAQRGAAADFQRAGGSRKAAAPGDLAGRMLEQQYISQYQSALGNPEADPAKAAEDFESKVLQLRKSRFIDPYGLQDAGEE